MDDIQIITEAHVTVPLNDNEGNSIADHVDGFVNALLDAFGGVTIVPNGVGIWRSPTTGNVHEEPIARITIAAHWDAKNDLKLKRLASMFAYVAEQEAVYVCDGAGDVSFVSKPSAEVVEGAEAVKVAMTRLIAARDAIQNTDDDASPEKEAPLLKELTEAMAELDGAVKAMKAINEADIAAEESIAAE